MFKKIRSNRDPEKTIWSELSNEFSPYISKANLGFSSFLNAYSKQAYIGMMLLIIASAILSFTVFRNTDDPLASAATKATKVQVQPPPQIDMLKMIDLMEESVFIKKRIDSLAAKEVLSAQDSITITNSFNRLEKLESILTTQK